MQRSLLASPGWTGQSLVILSLTTAMFFVGVHNVGCGGCHGRQDHAGSFVVMDFSQARVRLLFSQCSVSPLHCHYFYYTRPRWFHGRLAAASPRPDREDREVREALRMLRCSVGT